MKTAFGLFATWFLFAAGIPLMASDAAPLGSPDFYPSPERPVGWRGDGSGRFPGATPPTLWSRQLADITSEIMVQAVKPKGKPGADSHAQAYFTLKDWLVAGPFLAPDPEKDIDNDFLGGEAEVQPDAGDKAGNTQWRLYRASEGSQTFYDFNQARFFNMWVDFVYALGTLVPPEKPYSNGSGVPHYAGVDRQAAYAHTYLYSPHPADVNLTIKHPLPAVKVWINGTPQRVLKSADLWSSNKPEIKIHLNEGWNRLLVKAICDQAVKHYYARYTEDNKETLWHFAAYIRPAGDGPFSYETKNIAWMTKLTGHSASQPIVVGDKLFVGSADSDLFCLDKNSGRVLWMHTGTSWDAMNAEEGAAVKDKAEPLLVELEKINAELVRLLNENISPQGLDSSHRAIVDKKLKERTKLVKSVHDALSTGQKGKLYLNEFSAGDATPTSDGKQVYWVVQGHGGYLASAFDLNGKRIWSCFNDQGDSSEHGPHSSPLLCEGKLIVKMRESWVAYDAATGKELWRTPGFPNTSTDAPIVVPFDGKRALQTSKNLVSLDGAVLAECGCRPGFLYIPIVEDGVLYNASTGGSSQSFRAMAIPKLHSTKPEIIWEMDAGTLYGQEGRRGTGCYISSPLYVDGLVYMVDAYGSLKVISTKGRKLAYERWMDGYGFNYDRASYTASPSFAGKYIYMLDAAGYMTILKPDAEGTVVGHNVLQNTLEKNAASAGTPASTNNPRNQELFFAGMYFDGKRMFLHGEEYLYCIEDETAK